MALPEARLQSGLQSDQAPQSGIMAKRVERPRAALLVAQRWVVHYLSRHLGQHHFKHAINFPPCAFPVLMRSFRP
jgi:hypothetical protein